mgnify:CR=1 FL=1
MCKRQTNKNKHPCIYVYALYKNFPFLCRLITLPDNDTTPGRLPLPGNIPAYRKAVYPINGGARTKSTFHTETDFDVLHTTKK